MAINETNANPEDDGVEAEADTQEVQVEKEPDGRIRKKEIYDHVTVATGLRKREVREAVDATLAYFHKCLTEGKDLQIPPLGKIKTIERGEGVKAKLIHKVLLQSPKKDDEDSKVALAGSENDD